jgi:hypothetical protein
VAAADGFAEVLALEAPSAATASGRQLLRENEDGACDGGPPEDEEEQREGEVVPGHRFPYRRAPRASLPPVGTTIGEVGVVAIVLAACALALVVGAEWPRIAGRTGWNIQPRRRQRRRRRSGLTVIEGGDSDDFARSVERDLENLPVLDDRDDRTRS